MDWPDWGCRTKAEQRLLTNLTIEEVWEQLGATANADILRWQSEGEGIRELEIALTIQRFDIAQNAGELHKMMKLARLYPEVLEHALAKLVRRRGRPAGSSYVEFHVNALFAKRFLSSVKEVWTERYKKARRTAAQPPTAEDVVEQAFKDAGLPLLANWRK